MKAAEVMTAHPESCHPGDDVEVALSIMDANECGVVPIVDEDGRIVGIVTDRDILFGARRNGGSLAGLDIEACMTKDPVTARPDDSLEEVVQRMARVGVRRIPIVDDRGKLEGIVAQADLATQVDNDALVAEYLRKVSAAPAHEPAPER
jgi:CBS domain-containing protein